MSKFNKFLILISNFFLLPILLILLSTFLFSYFNNVIRDFYFVSFILTMIVYDLISFILLGITGKSTKTYIVMSIFLFIILIVNQLKISYTGEPLYFSDFNFVGSASNLLGIVADNIGSKISSLCSYFILFILLFIILGFYVFRVKFSICSIKTRIISFSIGILGLFFLFYPFSWSKEVYQKTFFLEFDDYNSYTDYVSIYSIYGVFGGMYYQLLDSRVDIPDDYNSSELDNILNNIESNGIEEKTLGTPNIIVILAESFFDVNLFKDDISFDREITSYFNKLKSEGELINIISPSYGGMTANVTYELLTGGNMSYFSKGYIPFMQLYNKKNAYQMPSIVRELANNSYHSKVILGQDSYNSKKVFDSLGFNDYVELEVTIENRKGYYVSDDYLADLIIAELEKKNKKSFLLVETMQSHMNYSYSKYPRYDINISSSNLDDYDNDVLLSYAQGIWDTDRMLSKVYEAVKRVEEDTIIVFFGDHLPYLENVNGDNVVDKLSYFNTGDELEDTYRLYNTQALVLSNYNYESCFPNNLGFDLLLTNLINNMDIEVSPYYRWLFSTRDVLPAYNRYISISNSEVNNISKLDNEQLDTLNLRKSMMYKFFIEG